MESIESPVPVIWETEWKVSPTQLAWFKHVYAFKGNKCFVAVATKTLETRFLSLPMMRGTAIEFDIVPGRIESDEEEVKMKVYKWLQQN